MEGIEKTHGEIRRDYEWLTLLRQMDAYTTPVLGTLKMLSAWFSLYREINV